MSNVRVVSFDSLLVRLKGVLGDDSLLYERFEVALKNRDDEMVGRAMDSLNLYPEDVRREVQDAMLAWLFDADDASGLADVETAGSLPN
jgi:hypothetical protein